MSSLDPGTVLAGRYFVRRALGSGGYGQVLLADDRELNRPVAIKVLRTDLDDRDAIARFLREARATAKLRHPNIVQVFDHGRTQDGADFIVYEYVEGTSAAEASRMGPPPEPHRVASWGKAVADALATAHAAGILHRDVKPENILLRRDLTPVLADFGIAHLAADQTVKTATGLILATPLYLAPEVYAGRPQSPASDQYALAATLYELLFGVPVHPDQSPAAVLARLGAGIDPPVPPPGARMRAPGLERVLARALARDPAARHADLSAFSRELAAVATPSAPWAPGAQARSLSDSTTEVGPSDRAPTSRTLLAAPPLVEPGAPLPSRPRPWAAPAVVALLAVTGIGLLARVRPTPAEPPPASPGPGEPTPAELAWAELERDFKTVSATFAKATDGVPVFPLPFDRRQHLRNRPDLLGDPLLPVRVERFLGSLTRWIREAEAGEVAPSARPRLAAMIAGYLASELPALAGIEDEMSQGSLKAAFGAGTRPSNWPWDDSKEWVPRWSQIRLAAERAVSGLPPRSRQLELEVSVLAGLLQAIVGAKGYREALDRVVAATAGPLGWDWRGAAVDVCDRLVGRLVRDQRPPCDLAGSLVAVAGADFARAPPPDPGRRRIEAGRALRMVGAVGAFCLAEVESRAAGIEPMVAALEELALTAPEGVRVDLEEVLRSRTAIGLDQRIPLVFPAPLAMRLTDLLARLRE